MSDTIKKLTIEGFKSIRELKDFELRSLNVLIGANGAGKSNFVAFFRLLRQLIDQRLQVAVGKEGGAGRCLYLGPKVTKQFVAKLYFGSNGYEFVLIPTANDRLIFEREEAVHYHRIAQDSRWQFGSGHAEARLRDHKVGEPRRYHIGPNIGQIIQEYPKCVYHRNGTSVVVQDEQGHRDLLESWGEDTSKWDSYKGVAHHVFDAVSSWVVYHFHDTSDTAAVRLPGQINDNEFLRPNAENLAAFLDHIRETNPASYQKIRDVVRLAAPFFDDFKLRPMDSPSTMIQLEWLQKDSDYPFLASQLSDGTLRFICLATALLQPSPPPTILFDEPELGLHPYALTLLANLFQQVAGQHGKQVIVSTQSAPLVSEFAPEDVVIVERTGGQSTFRPLDSAHLSEWLQEYSLGELWQKNVLGGRPQSEEAPQPSNSETTRA